MRIDYEVALPVRWLQWEHNGRRGIIFQPTVPAEEQVSVIADAERLFALASLPHQVGVD